MATRLLIQRCLAAASAQSATSANSTQRFHQHLAEREPRLQHGAPQAKASAPPALLAHIKISLGRLFAHHARKVATLSEKEAPLARAACRAASVVRPVPAFWRSPSGHARRGPSMRSEATLQQTRASHALPVPMGVLRARTAVAAARAVLQAPSPRKRGTTNARCARHRPSKTRRVCRHASSARWAPSAHSARGWNCRQRASPVLTPTQQM